MSKLTSLQTIKLGGGAFQGDRSQKTDEEYPFNYNNTLTMKSGIARSNEYLDLPLLGSFIGGGDNFEYYGSVILESICSNVFFRRHPFIIIRQYTVIELL